MRQRRPTERQHRVPGGSHRTAGHPHIVREAVSPDSVGSDSDSDSDSDSVSDSDSGSDRGSGSGSGSGSDGVSAYAFLIG